MLKIGSMDILWKQKLVFMSSYSEGETGIYSYPIPEKLNEFQQERTPSPRGRHRRDIGGTGSTETDMNENNRMKKLNVRKCLLY